MNANVTLLPTRAVRINAEAVAMLEDFLAQAKAGHIIAVGIVGVRPDHVVNTGATECTPVCPLIGGLEILKHRIITGATS